MCGLQDSLQVLYPVSITKSRCIAPNSVEAYSMPGCILPVPPNACSMFLLEAGHCGGNQQQQPNRQAPKHTLR
jgi:hypothetical protein